MDQNVADLLGIDLEDADERREVEAIERDMLLIETLVRTRAELDLTQQQVADRMGVSQPTVSNFERLGGDPRLSTIRRYALALGAVVRHQVLVTGGDRSTTGRRTAVGVVVPTVTGAPLPNQQVGHSHTASNASVVVR